MGLLIIWRHACPYMLSTFLAWRGRRTGPGYYMCPSHIYTNWRSYCLCNLLASYALDFIHLNDGCFCGVEFVYMYFPFLMPGAYSPLWCEAPGALLCCHQLLCMIRSPYRWYIYYDEVSVCLFVCNKKSSLPPGSLLWPPELPITTLYNSGLVLMVLDCFFMVPFRFL